MPIAILAIALLYMALVLQLWRPLRRLLTAHPADKAWEPLVSVIVALRDEAALLPACLQALQQLDYPAGKLEILLVDDASIDGSSAILNDFCTRHAQARCIRLEAGQKELPGKAGAVYAAMPLCRGEVILETDADCLVPAGWIRTMLASMDEGTGMVCGFTWLQWQPPGEAPAAAGARFAAIQALDWLFLLGIAAAAIRRGKPLSWMGNNMAFRRCAYDAVGGYAALGPSLIEDFALLDAISRRSPWRVAVSADPSAAVRSSPVHTLAGLYRQRRRWALGIRQVRLFGQLLMVTSFLAHLGVIAGLISSPVAGLAALLLLVAGDLLICREMARATDNQRLLRHFAGFELLYFAYTLLLPLLIIVDRRIRWKGQNFPAHQK